MERFHNMRFRVSSQVDTQTSDVVCQLLVGAGAVAMEEAAGLDGCDLYVAHLSATQLNAGAMPAPAHSRGLRMLLSADNSNGAALAGVPTQPAAAAGVQLAESSGDNTGMRGSIEQADASRAPAPAAINARFGLIASPRLSGGHAYDCELRRALKLAHIECISARDVLEQLGTRSTRGTRARTTAASPARGAPARGAALAQLLQPRAVNVRPPNELFKGGSNVENAGAVFARRAVAPAGDETRLPLECGGGRADAGARLGARPSAATEQTMRRVDSAECRARMELARSESLCGTEVSHATATTTATATTATTTAVVAAATHAPPDKPTCAGRRSAPDARPATARTTAVQPRASPLGPPPSKQPGLTAAPPQSARALARPPAFTSEKVLIPPRAGVTGVPVQIQVRRPLAAAPQVHHAAPADGSACGPPASPPASPRVQCELCVADLNGTYKPLVGTIDENKLRRMWPGRLAAAEARAAAAARRPGGLARVPAKRSRARADADAGADGELGDEAKKRAALAPLPGGAPKLNRCDVCNGRFERLDEHLASAQHRAVVEQTHYFVELDAFVERHGLGVTLRVSAPAAVAPAAVDVAFADCLAPATHGGGRAECAAT